jgi:hypothetical protein
VPGDRSSRRTRAFYDLFIANRQSLIARIYATIQQHQTISSDLVCRAVSTHAADIFRIREALQRLEQKGLIEGFEEI